MRLSTVILPIYRWADEGRDVWRRAEELGFHAAYTSEVRMVTGPACRMAVSATVASIAFSCP